MRTDDQFGEGMKPLPPIVWSRMMSVIEIKNLTKIFEVEGHTVTALCDIDLSIE